MHGVHLTEQDVRSIGAAGATVCACPTTEADLGDGIAPFAELARAGARLCLGTDQHVQTDLLAEAQRLDQHERLRSGERATFRPAGLLHELTVAGHRSLGWPLAGEIARGHRLDLVSLELDSVRTAGAALDQVLLVRRGGRRPRRGRRRHRRWSPTGCTGSATSGGCWPTRSGRSGADRSRVVVPRGP